MSSLILTTVEMWHTDNIPQISQSMFQAAFPLSVPGSAHSDGLQMLLGFSWWRTFVWYSRRGLPIFSSPLFAGANLLLKVPGWEPRIFRRKRGVGVYEFHEVLEFWGGRDPLWTLRFHNACSSSEDESAASDALSTCCLKAWACWEVGWGRPVRGKYSVTQRSCCMMLESCPHCLLALGIWSYLSPCWWRLLWLFFNPQFLS